MRVVLSNSLKLYFLVLPRTDAYGFDVTVQHQSARKQRQQGRKARDQRSVSSDFILGEWTDEEDEEGASVEQVRRVILSLTCELCWLICCYLVFLALAFVQVAILQRSSSILSDVVDEFSEMANIVGRFKQWKTQYSGAYQQAFGGESLLKIITPLVKLQLLPWNPLATDSIAFQNLNFMSAVATYDVGALLCALSESLFPSSSRPSCAGYLPVVFKVFESHAF